MDKGHPMRICFVSLNSYPLFQTKSRKYFGGAELQISLIAKYLAKNKQFKITVVTGDYGQKMVIKKGQITIYRTFNRGIHKVIELGKFFITALKINADVYVERTANELVGPLTLFCWLFRKKFIYMVAHDWDCYPDLNNLLTGIHRYLFHLGLDKSSLIICQTINQQNSLKNRFNSSKIIVMPSIMPPSSNKSQSSKKIVLWVGRADFWKRPVEFIKLALSLPTKNFVMICRQGNNVDFFNQVKRLAKKQKNILFLSAIPIEKIAAYFTQAKIFVNTSIAEGFPNTFIQAGMTKTPVLSLKVNPDNYINRFNCGLVAQNNRQQLIRYCSNILKDDKRAKIMGNNHFDYMIKYHRPENIKIFTQALCNL